MKWLLKTLLEALLARGIKIDLSFPYEDSKKYLPSLHLSVGTNTSNKA